MAKGFLFLLAGVMAAAALLLEFPTLKVAFLLGLAIWCFARFYYFAFYVIEHYVDSSYRFAGLGSFVLYLVRRWRGREPGVSEVAELPTPVADQGLRGSIGASDTDRLAGSSAAGTGDD